MGAGMPMGAPGIEQPAKRLLRLPQGARRGHLGEFGETRATLTAMKVPDHIGDARVLHYIPLDKPESNGEGKPKTVVYALVESPMALGTYVHPPQGRASSYAAIPHSS